MLQLSDNYKAVTRIDSIFDVKLSKKWAMSRNVNVKEANSPECTLKAYFSQTITSQWDVSLSTKNIKYLVPTYCDLQHKGKFCHLLWY